MLKYRPVAMNGYIGEIGWTYEFLDKYEELGGKYVGFIKDSIELRSDPLIYDTIEWCWQNNIAPVDEDTNICFVYILEQFCNSEYCEIYLNDNKEYIRFNVAQYKLDLISENQYSLTLEGIYDIIESEISPLMN